MGITTLSIIALTTSTLLMDLLNPCSTRGYASHEWRLLVNEDTDSAFRTLRFSLGAIVMFFADRAGNPVVFLTLDPTNGVVPRDLPPSGSTCWNEFSGPGRVLGADFAIRNSSCWRFSASISRVIA
jgi:hypothetical protein